MMNGAIARMDFLNAVEIFKQAFPDMGTKQIISQFKLTQSDLQLEQALVANQGTYTFPVMTNQQSAGLPPTNTEIRLNPQDTFVPQYIGVFLIPASSATDTTWRPATWCNPVAFPVNNVQMQSIYNGTLNVSVNNTNYITKWKLDRHLYVPETQQTAALGAGSPADELDGSEYAYHPLQPYVIISGSSNMGVTINLPVAPTAVEAFSRIAIVFKGVIAYNSTVTT